VWRFCVEIREERLSRKRIQKQSEHECLFVSGREEGILRRSFGVPPDLWVS